jgi:hypothetical protein
MKSHYVVILTVFWWGMCGFKGKSHYVFILLGYCCFLLYAPASLRGTASVSPGGNIVAHDGRTCYRNVAEKTAHDSFVPVSPVALVILEAREFDLSGGANQDSNRKLKMITALAGINTNMANGGDGITPKSALVTTHTARRSAATNLLLDGVPISEIMQLGGVKSNSRYK